MPDEDDKKNELDDKRAAFSEMMEDPDFKGFIDEEAAKKIALKQKTAKKDEKEEEKNWPEKLSCFKKYPAKKAGNAVLAKCRKCFWAQVCKGKVADEKAHVHKVTGSNFSAKKLK